MNCVSGAFRRPWSWLSIFPIVREFMPTSRAIWTWACDRRWRVRASIQLWSLAFTSSFGSFPLTAP